MINYTQRIKDLITKTSADAYQINMTNKYSYELYYVTNKLETARLVEVVEYYVTIYKDFEEYRGSSSFTLSQAFTDDEATEKINEAIKRSLFVKNKYYDLPMPKAITKTDESNLANKNLKEVALEVAKAIQKADIYQDGWINSSEIFVTRLDNTFINSNGVNVTYPSYKVMIEVIPTWKGEKEEVELYFSSTTNELDLDRITNDVNNKLLDAKNRGEAKQVPDDLKDCKVILRAQEANEIFSFFASELQYSTQYCNMSHYKLGDSIQKQEENGDLLNIEMKAMVKGSAASKVIDGLGTVLVDKKIIDSGKAISLYGDSQYGYYLGEKDITGLLKNVCVTCGTKSYEEMKKDKYLLCINFSAFQLDDSSGYYGGEVRLGILFDGKKAYPVSGFSVSGNIFEDISKMKFSKEKEVLSGYSGPKYIEVNMTVSK